MLFIDLPLFLASTFSISSFLSGVAARAFSQDMAARLVIYLPFLMALGIGLTITNTKAVIEVSSARRGAFARTPKVQRGIQEEYKLLPANTASGWAGAFGSNS